MFFKDIVANVFYWDTYVVFSRESLLPQCTVVNLRKRQSSRPGTCRMPDNVFVLAHDVLNAILWYCFKEYVIFSIKFDLIFAFTLESDQFQKKISPSLAEVVGCLRNQPKHVLKQVLAP